MVVETATPNVPTATLPSASKTTCRLFYFLVLVEHGIVDETPNLRLGLGWTRHISLDVYVHVENAIKNDSSTSWSWLITPPLITFTERPKNSCQTHEINIHVFFWSWYHFVAMYRMISSSLVKRWSWHVVLLELLSENFCSQNVVLLKLFTKNAGTMNRISWYWMNIIQNDTWSCLNCWRKMLHTKHGLAWTFHGKRRNNEQNILVLDECYPKRRCSPFGIYFTTEPVASLFLRKKNSKICSRLLYAAVHVSLRL